MSNQGRKRPAQCAKPLYARRILCVKWRNDLQADNTGIRGGSGLDKVFIP